MDDLNGLDWSAAPNQSKVPPGTGNYYPTLRPTPPPVTLGHSTPLSAQPSAVPKAFAAPKSSTPDSFSNLVSFGSSKSTTLTLQQQQEKLQAEKKRQEEEKKKQYDAQFGNGQFWDGLGHKAQGFAGIPPATSRTTISSAASPFRPLSPPTANDVSVTGTGEDEDLFAAFNSKTKVDSSSHYPAPSNPTSGRNTPGFSTNKTDLTNPQAWEKPSTPLSGVDLGDDDDPFGLGQMSTRNTAPAPTTMVDDDFLGDLGKPVEEVRRPVKASAAPKPIEESDSDSDSEPETNDPWDKAVAELVEMGFSAQNSRRALTESGSGLDIQAAVGWLLNDAHRQAKEKQQKREPSGNNGTASERRERPREGGRSKANRAWMDEEGRERSQPKREDNRSPASGDDFSKAAAAVGSNLFKTANSLWKTSQKTVKKAVAELQYDSTGGDPSQPKWMREAAEREAQERNGGRRAGKARAEPEVTDEALMLEAGSGPPQRKPRAAEQRYPPSSSNYSRDGSPAFSERPSQSQPPRWQQTKPATPLDAKSRLSKQAIEDDAAKAYVSSARRKKPTPKPQPQEPELDLFSTAPSQPFPQPKPASSRPTPRSTPIPSKPSTPIPTRPKAPPRTIPHLSSIALQSSNQHRLAGTTHFKRGDYAAAHTSYTASLSSLPPNHPITVILFCNRALTSLKTGVPRAAVEDADKAMVIIGVARGDGETIDLGNGETKEMKEFWGKALMRKAEALEQMEQWKNAGAVWQEAVEAGVGGATSIQGRQRCEKALAPKAAPRTATPKPRPTPKPRSALSDLGGSKDSEAVERLRAANIAAEKADDEKFALADSVDARISQWRDGKRDNLRALLGSLDKVLWEGSGWNKVGMHELVINSKVKIAYMKAIGKCHPDKLPQDASTEIKLIAATVFSTLNESWDKFKAENGM